jgi:hypothetical protein
MLHAIPSNKLLTIFAPFHIGQAVPIFMVIAGITSTLFATKNNVLFRLSNEYSIPKLNKYLARIVAPFTFIWIVEMCFMICLKNITPKQMLLSYFAGGIGPGGYFTPIIIQHLLIFPLILWLIDNIKSHSIVIFGFFLFSLFIEWLCIQTNIPAPLYRLLYVRYIYAVVLGVYIAKYGISSSIMLLSLPSMAYIAGVSYFNFESKVIYPARGFEHAPAYFYTVVIIQLLWCLHPYIRRTGISLAYIGQSSYHIFLFQMLYFWMFGSSVLAIVHSPLIWLMLNIVICISLGCLFFKIQEVINNFMKLNAKKAFHKTGLATRQ